MTTTATTEIKSVSSLVQKTTLNYIRRNGNVKLVDIQKYFSNLINGTAKMDEINTCLSSLVSEKIVVKEGDVYNALECSIIVSNEQMLEILKNATKRKLTVSATYTVKEGGEKEIKDVQLEANNYLLSPISSTSKGFEPARVNNLIVGKTTFILKGRKNKYTKK